MSQLFDSLRHDRDPRPRIQTPRTAHGDAVLATLGYARGKQRPSSLRSIAATALLLGIVAVVWAGWTFYDRSAPARSLPRTSSPSAVARRQPPHATSPSAAGSLLPVAPDSPPTSQPGSPSPTSQLASARDENTRQAVAGTQAVPPVAPSRSPGPSVARAPLESLPAPSPAPIARASVRPTAGELEMALHDHRAGDFENALQHYRAALAENELNAQAHNNLGLLYQEKQLLAESARELHRALVIEPRNPGARNNLGVTLLMQGKVAEATGEFRAVLAGEPQNLDALVNLGLAQRMNWQFDQAKETLIRALTIAPRNAAAHYNLGQLYDEINEPARAVEHYRTFLDTAGAEQAPRAAAVRARIAALSRTPE